MTWHGGGRWAPIPGNWRSLWGKVLKRDRLAAPWTSGSVPTARPGVHV